MTHYEEYYSIINYRKVNKLPADRYGEKHHIKPRSLYPELVNDPDNIVLLSASEHFLAHYHLWKYYKEELKDKIKARSMCYAFTMMKRAIQKSDDIETMSLLYSEVKKNLSRLQKGKNNPSYKKAPWNKGLKNVQIAWNKGLKGFGKNHFVSDETKRKISEANKGRTVTDEVRLKISNTLTGRKYKPRSDESKQNSRNAWTKEKKEEQSKKFKNRVFTEEWRKKLSEGAKLREARKKNRLHNNVTTAENSNMQP